MEMMALLDRGRSLGPNVLLNELDQAGNAVASAIGADSPLRSRLLALRDRLQNERLQIAVLGQFKRGKSTFVNALLGAPVLPTAVVPLTAIATFIAWREEPLIHVQFTDGRPPEHFTASQADGIREILFRFVTEEANPKNYLGVERVELFYPAAILADGTVLIDTPGIGSTLAHNTEAALRLLPECDASLFVVSADPPITEAELGYLRRLRPKTGRMFFVVNKVDYLSPDDQRAVADFLRKVLTDGSLIDPGAPIFGVSARLGLSAKQQQNHDAWKRSGMAEIEDHLVRYLATEKMQSLHEAIRRQAADVLSQATGEVELRANALKMPLEQLERKSSEFAQTLRSIEAQRLTIGDLLSGDRRRLVSDLEARIQDLREDASSILAGVIDDSLTHAENTWEGKVKSAVSIAIEELFGNAGEHFVDAFSRQAGDVLSNHRRRVDALVGEVRRTAAEMFNVTFAPEGEAKAFRLAQEPYWVTERIASTLIPDFSRLIDRFLPASLRRRRRRRRIIEETKELIVRNAESLRWAILRGLDETFRAAATQLEERLSDAIAATKGVIEDALTRRRDRSFAAEAALARLDRSIKALAAIRQSLLAIGSIELIDAAHSRPRGQELLHAFKPTVELKLNPLPASAAKELARRLIDAEAVATTAALRSKGNPLFVEQFAAWAAETNFQGGEAGPHTLHQIIAVRIEHLSKVRIAGVRRGLGWGTSWTRQVADDELGQIEVEVGRWLDRLETGDYADRVEAARHLVRLERLDYEIFLASMLAGRPRPRSSRLREAIERLLIGSADQILADLKLRAAKATNATKEDIGREAQRTADVLFAAFNWALARDFYELAYSHALWEKDEIGRRLAQCRRHSQEAIRNDSEVYSASAGLCLDEKPSVDAVDLPYIWADLGRLHHRSRYFARAGEAAEAINDHALAAWTERKAAELRANKEALPGS
jgi:predicted GTPase